MNIKMTPIAALVMAVALGACQEDDSSEATDTGATDSAAGTEEAGETEGESTGTGSAVTEQSADQGVSTDPVATSDSADVEEGPTDTGAASQEAPNVATDAAQDGENPTTTADAATEEIAEEEGTVGAEAGADGSLDEVLTPEGFDADRIIAAIDESDLDDARKESLREITRAAAEDPSQVDAAVETLRAELLGEDGADAADAIGPGRDFAATPGSLFSPAQFGGASEYAIEGARLAGMRIAIFADAQLPSSTAD